MREDTGLLKNGDIVKDCEQILRVSLSHPWPVALVQLDLTS